MALEIVEQDEILFQEFIDDFVNQEQDIINYDNIANIYDPIFSIYSLDIPTEPVSELIEASFEENHQTTFDTSSPSNSSHKRSLDELSDDRIQSLPDSPTYDLISLTNEPSYSDFSIELAAAFNQGSISKVAMVMEKYFDPNCMIKLAKPDYEIVNYGSNIVIRLYQALMNAHPDGVVTVHKKSTIRKNGHYIVNCNLRFRGTRLFKNAMDEFLYDGFEAQQSIMNFFDRTKMSTEEIEGFERLEREMIAKEEVPMMFVKISVTMVFDEHTQKMKMYTSKARLSSFRPVNPKEI
jgi:hypothetical protein